MKNNELSKQQIDAIMQALNELILQPGWDSSGFLRAINKKVQDIRDNFAYVALGTKKESEQAVVDEVTRTSVPSGQQEVFIALYCADGDKLTAWERILSNLPTQMISRPIYAHEDDVTAAYGNKDNRNNDAYVSIYINPEDLLHLGDKAPQDKLGKPLLTLKAKSLRLENVNRFVHASGTYAYVQGRLVKSVGTQAS